MGSLIARAQRSGLDIRALLIDRFAVPDVARHAARDHPLDDVH